MKKVIGVLDHFNFVILYQQYSHSENIALTIHGGELAGIIQLRKGFLNSNACEYPIGIIILGILVAVMLSVTS